MYSTAKPKPLQITKKNILRTSPKKSPLTTIIETKKKGKKLFGRSDKKSKKSNIVSQKNTGGIN